MNINTNTNKHFQLPICLTPSSQSSNSKRFQRKRENSNQSLNENRKSCKKGLNSDRDVLQKRIIPEQKPKTDQKQKILKKNQYFTLIKNTAYIKPFNIRDQLYNMNSELKFSKQKLHESEKKMTLTENTDIEEHQQFHDKNQPLYNEAHNTSQTKLSEKNTTNKSHNSQKCNINQQQQKSSSISNISFGLQIKCKQLFVLQQQNSHLREINTNKKTMITNLQSRVEQLSIQNYQMKKTIQLARNEVKHLISKYSNPLKNKHQQQQYQNLPNFIKNNLTQSLEQIITSNHNQYHNILHELNIKISHQNTLISGLQLKTKFNDHFKDQNKQLKCINSRLREQIQKMGKRNQYLHDENSTLRVSNCKLKKSILELKNINNKGKQKQKQGWNNRVGNNYGKNYTKDEVEFSFEMSPEISNIDNKKNDYQLEALTDSEDGNNQSMNISDVSTEQLMDQQEIQEVLS